MRLVIVRWQDSSQPVASWRYVSDIEENPKPIECATVGWLIRDTPEVKVICQSVGDLHGENAQAGGVMTIPARCIISIEALKEVTSSPCPVPSSRPGSKPKRPVSSHR